MSTGTKTVPGGPAAPACPLSGGPPFPGGPTCPSGGPTCSLPSVAISSLLPAWSVLQGLKKIFASSLVYRGRNRDPQNLFRPRLLGHLSGPEGRLLPHRIARLKLPWFVGRAFRRDILSLNN